MSAAAALPIFADRALALPLLSKVAAGFPSPAEDFLGERLDIGAELVKHPQATFLLRISGHSMEQLGIFDGDVVVGPWQIPGCGCLKTHQLHIKEN